jgi:hypothetical protein
MAQGAAKRFYGHALKFSIPFCHEIQSFMCTYSFLHFYACALISEAAAVLLLTLTPLFSVQPWQKPLPNSAAKTDYDTLTMTPEVYQYQV